MELKEYLSFFGDNLLFSSTIVLVSFVLGWILYNHVILTKICLKQALFEKDNIAAWFEFIGAFIFPTLYLGAKAVQGPASSDIVWDWVICTIYLVVYMVAFTLLRLASGWIVKLIGQEDKEGKIRLNHEIYNQKNIAAALFSVALSTIFVNIIKFIDMTTVDDFKVALLKSCTILIFTLVAFIIYCLVVRRRTTVFKEIFIDNNPAAGVSLLGFIFAVGVILSSVVSLREEFDILVVSLLSLISLVIFGVLAFLFKMLFSRMIKIDIWKEVYEQDSVGAAIGQAALYMGIANVIVHFMI